MTSLGIFVSRTDERRRNAHPLDENIKEAFFFPFKNE